jgi:hypothetical protein
VICVSLAVAACAGAPRTAALAPGPDPVAAQTALRNWLECEECWDGELAAVVALGDEVTPSLAATLREGMSPAARARLARQLGERYDERAAWAEAHPETRPTMTRKEYVEHHVANRDALYRVRAARALGQIRTPAALLVLREELERTEHEGIREEIRRVLGAG